MKLSKIFIVILMMFMLVGCNKETPKDIETSHKNNTSTTISTPSSNQETSFSIGKWKNSVYTNDFLDIKYTLPEGWVKYTDDQIASLMNISADLTFGDNDFVKEVANLTSVYYFMTQDPVTSNNVSLYSEKPIFNLTLDEYIEALKTQLLAVDVFDYKINKVTNGKLGNKDVKILDVSSSMSGYTLSQRYYIYKLDEYFVGVIATSITGEKGINEIINCFE